MSINLLSQKAIVNPNLALRSESLRVNSMQVDQIFDVYGQFTYQTNAQSVAASGSVALTAPYVTLTITGCTAAVGASNEVTLTAGTYVSVSTGSILVNQISYAGTYGTNGIPLVIPSLEAGVWKLRIFNVGAAGAGALSGAIIVQVTASLRD